MYKWVDAQGNVNYSQTAPRSGQAQTIETPNSQVSPEEARSRLESLTGKSEEQRQNRELLAKDEKDEGALKARRKENCSVARRNLEILQTSPRVQSKGADGNLFYLSEEAKQRKLEQTQAQIAEFCN